MNQAPSFPGTVRVLVCDDHAIWRGGVRSLLEDTRFEVVGEAASGAQAIDKTRELRPDLVLLDIRMAGGDGLDALAAIKAEFARTVVVMLTTYDNPTYLARAIAGGASGYILKGVDGDEFLSSLDALANGETLLSPDDLKRALRGVERTAIDGPELIQPLSPREAEVLRLLATGASNREIAALLFVAESTVKSHVEHIIRKLGVSDRVQAAVWAARQGVLDDHPRKSAPSSS